MVTILLTNKTPHPHSSKATITINKDERICTLDNGQKIELKQLINNSEFTHPLLSQPSISASKKIFHYEYDDLEGLLNSAIYVYSTLLHNEKALSYPFKINPSSSFKRKQNNKNIFFSMDPYKAAQESISTKQLEDLCSQYYGFKYHFSEDVIIDDLFTVHDLPKSIDGDLLYSADAEIIKILKAPPDYSRFELRYINHIIGFGVFCREFIQVNDIISIYSGVKKVNHETNSKYRFKIYFDLLNQHLDASSCGNICRFINHASTNTTSSSSSNIRTKNIRVENYTLNGIEFIIFRAIQDIHKGEQLFIDYGSEYFEERNLYHFNKEGNITDSNKRTIKKNYQLELRNKQLMANHGVKEAQTYFYFRWTIATIIISALMMVLNYL